MRKLAILIGLVAAVAACSRAPGGDTLAYDPNEPFNRQAHAFNREVDAAAFGPVARAYGTTVPQDVRHKAANLRDNWRLPGQVIQYGLQGRGTAAAKSTTRFAVNTLLGLGGLLDIAAEMGLPYEETGFDEVFHSWGIPEGGYLELPVGGPGTERDWTGYAFDQLLDPTWYVLPVAASNALLALGGLDIVNDRYELDPVVEALLHESADSYSAQRIAYLQNKQARLAGGTDIDELEDIYADQ